MDPDQLKWTPKLYGGLKRATSNLPYTLRGLPQDTSDSILNVKENHELRVTVELMPVSTVFNNRTLVNLSKSLVGEEVCQGLL